MRIGLDIDGVVCDFANPANEYIANLHGVAPIPVDRWDWYKGYGVRSEEAWQTFWQDVERSSKQSFFESLEPEPYALEGIDRLENQGHDVCFITARPLWAKEATEEWFKNHWFGHLDIHFEKVKHVVDRDLYVDDAVHQVTALQAEGKRAVLMLQPHNVQEWFKDKNLVGIESLRDLAISLEREAEARIHA